MSFNAATAVWKPRVDWDGAVALDTKLRFLATAETRVKRMMGVALSRLFDSNQLISVGPAKRSDYVRERLGISLREAQELVRIERLIPQYPETDRLWRAGRIGRCHVREILRRVSPEDDFAWARLAASMTVRQLIDRLTACGLKTLPDPADEPETTFQFAASAELYQKWSLCQELANRQWGRDVGPAGLLDTLVMEATSEAPADFFRKLDDVWEAPSQDWRKDLAKMQADGERRLQLETHGWSFLNWGADDPIVPDLTLPDDADVFVLDSKLRAARDFLQEVTGLLMRALRQAQQVGLDQVLQFRSLGHHAQERLGMSISNVNGLLRLQRSLARLPDVAEAYATGVLTRSQAEQVARVAGPTTASAWIAYGRTTTVRKLRQVVLCALSVPRPHPDLWPPELQTCASPVAQKLLDEVLARIPERPDEVEQTCAPADAVRVPDVSSPLPGTAVTIRFGLPTEVEEFVQQGLGLCRLALGPTASVPKCIELLLDTFLLEYLPEAKRAAKEHPIPERDLWQCLVPGCTNKARLHVHHFDLRSQGGGDEDWNRGSLCAAHHLQGIHAGRMLAKGHAPDDIAWVMGIRPDGRPGQLFIGERILYSAR